MQQNHTEGRPVVYLDETIDILHLQGIGNGITRNKYSRFDFVNVFRVLTYIYHLGLFMASERLTRCSV